MPLRTGRHDRLWIAAGVIVLGVLGLGAAVALLGGQDVKTLDEIAGVKCQTGEQLDFHGHVRLAIYVDGEPRDVPDHTGIRFAPRVTAAPGQPTPEPDVECLFWLHTHTDSLVHLEAPDNPGFTLGQFFQIWGQPLSATQLMDQAADGDRRVQATVNGEPFGGDPADIPLVDGSIISVQYGPPFVEPPTDLVD